MPWSPGETVVVLGAGATRGAEFVDGPGASTAQCLPPLNTDFFTQLQRITTARHQEAVRGVIQDVVDLYGPNFSLTLEQYFTQLEAMMATARDAKVVPPEFMVGRLTQRRSRLLEGLSAVLEESADVAKQKSPARRNPCSFHAAIVEVLEPRDTIISFNYDCVMDHALRTSGAGKWAARRGYGFPGSRRVEGHRVWSAEAPPTRLNSSINLLKLHGSINWYPFPDEESEPVRFRERPYKQAGQKLYEIVPPEYVKSANRRPIFKSLWSNAELALRRAKRIAFVGFSFTPTDLDVEAMFRLALASNKALERVVIVNPSPRHRQRIRTVLAQALEQGALLTQFGTLREFSSHTAEFLG